jgi:predicted nucleic acid-binding protein
MPSTRTQIYLTPEQRRRLDAIARRQDMSLAALVREAVDAYLAESGPDAETALASTFGRLGIRTPDALIAATALEHRLGLLTRNVRDFEPVPGLRVSSP